MKILDRNGVNVTKTIKWEEAPFYARRPRLVQAQQLSEPLTIVDSRGRKTGDTGDWLIRNEYGCIYLTSNIIFIDEFYKAPKEEPS